MKAMALNVNACLNRSGLNHNDQYFVRKIRTDISDRIKVGELTLYFSLFYCILYSALIFYLLNNR